MDHPYFFIGLAVVIWFVGVCILVSSETMEDVEHHDGGFLGLGFTTHTNRKPTVQDVRRAALWPVFFLLELFVRFPVTLLHEWIFLYTCLLFGFKYNETKIYRKIDDFLYHP